MHIPRLIAHRGYMEHYPENSLRGLEAALDQGAPCIEFDIQSTADHELVIFHDPDLLRTTGTGGSLLEMRYRDLQRISAHEPDRFDGHFYPTPVSRLADICPLLKRYPGAHALAEIKSASLERFGLRPVMDRLMEALAPVADQCTVIGYDRAALEYARAERGFPIGWVISSYDQRQRELAGRLRPEILIGEAEMFGPGQRPWPGPWSWMLYDITDPDLALSYAASGVELIETRDIGAMFRDPRLARRRMPYGGRHQP